MRRIIIKYLISLLLLFFVVIAVLKVFERTFTEKKIEIQISKLEVRTLKGGVNDYLIHTKNEVFDNRDDNYQKKSNSAELFKKLKKNKKYLVLVAGYKFGFSIPFISDRRNILEIIPSNRFR